MTRLNNEIAVHKCFFKENKKKVLDAIILIAQKDSPSINDTQAIRILLDVYDFFV